MFHFSLSDTFSLPRSFIYMQAYTHKHTHKYTHTYTQTYIHTCVCASAWDNICLLLKVLPNCDAEKLPVGTHQLCDSCLYNKGASGKKNG